MRVGGGQRRASNRPFYASRPDGMQRCLAPDPGIGSSACAGADAHLREGSACRTACRPSPRLRRRRRPRTTTCARPAPINVTAAIIDGRIQVSPRASAPARSGWSSPTRPRRAQAVTFETDELGGAQPGHDARRRADQPARHGDAGGRRAPRATTQLEHRGRRHPRRRGDGRAAARVRAGRPAAALSRPAHRVAGLAAMLARSGAGQPPARRTRRSSSSSSGCSPTSRRARRSSSCCRAAAGSSTRRRVPRRHRDNAPTPRRVTAAARPASSPSTCLDRAPQTAARRTSAPRASCAPPRAARASLLPHLALRPGRRPAPAALDPVDARLTPTSAHARRPIA